MYVLHLMSNLLQMTFLCDKHYVAMAAKMSEVILTEYGLDILATTVSVIPIYM